MTLLAFLTLACLVMGHPNRESSASASQASAAVSHTHEPSAPQQPDAPADENDGHCAATTAAVCALPDASGVALMLVVLALAIGMVWRSLPLLRNAARPAWWEYGDLASLSWPGRPALAVLCVSRR